MGKRKDDDIESASGSSSKRSRRIANFSNPIREQIKICQEIYKTIRNYKNEDDRILSETFVRVPSRRIYPDYYDLVSKPIDLICIQQKLKTNEYDTVDQFVVDVHLLFENAKIFYNKDSQEHKDASILLSIFDETKQKFFNDGDDQSVASERSPSQSKSTSPDIICLGDYDPVDRKNQESNESLSCAPATTLNPFGHFLHDNYDDSSDEEGEVKTTLTPEKIHFPWPRQKETSVAVKQKTSNDVASSLQDFKFRLSSGLSRTPKLNARMKSGKSGYILFAAAIRKKIMAENPDHPFGIISKLVGAEWKKLTDQEKKRYDERAEKIAAERERADLAPGGRLTIPPSHIRVWMCKWNPKSDRYPNCDWQFETAEQLYEHITSVHTNQIREGCDNQLVCLWSTCVKYKKDGRPFKSLPRLHRHMKEKHVHASSKCILPYNKSKNYVPLGSKVHLLPTPRLNQMLSQNQTLPKFPSVLFPSTMSQYRKLQSSTYVPSKYKEVKVKTRSKSGYILFAAAIRKKIMSENPDSTFGVISKLVGDEWRKLSEEDKKRYDEEAEKIATEKQKIDMAPGGRLAVPPGQIRVWLCKWRNCSVQFETTDQLYDHITTDHTGVEGYQTQFVCLWSTCVKYRANKRPFQSLPRLNRHMKEKHLHASSKCITPETLNKPVSTNSSSTFQHEYILSQLSSTISSFSSRQYSQSHLQTQNETPKGIFGSATIQSIIDIGVDALAQPSIPVWSAGGSGDSQEKLLLPSHDSGSSSLMLSQLLSSDNGRSLQRSNPIIEEKRAMIIKKRLNLEAKVKSMELKNRLVESTGECQPAITDAFEEDKKNIQMKSFNFVLNKFESNNCVSSDAQESMQNNEEFRLVSMG